MVVVFRRSPPKLAKRIEPRCRLRVIFDVLRRSSTSPLRPQLQTFRCIALSDVKGQSRPMALQQMLLVQTQHRSQIEAVIDLALDPFGRVRLPVRGGNQALGHQQEGRED